MARRNELSSSAAFAAVIRTKEIIQVPGSGMGTIPQYRFKMVACGLLVVAIVVDAVAKGVAWHAAMHLQGEGMAATGQLADMVSGAGMVAAVLAVCLWIGSARLRERGSQLPVMVLVGVYGLLFCIQV